MTKKILQQPNLLQLPPADREPEIQGLRSWALVELFGHQRIVGCLTADPVEFPGLVRVDVPDLIVNGQVKRKGFTRYLGKSALYGVTPIDEKTALEMLPHVDGAPSRPMSLRSYSGRDY